MTPYSGDRTSASVLVTGGSGLLALNWALAGREHQSVTLGLHKRAASLRGVQSRQVSLDTVDAVVRLLDLIQPGHVVHTAGLTSVEACESDPALANRANVDLAVTVARGCAQRGVPLAHISTDHLFRGDAPLASEDTPVDPQNVYARTKADAEHAVLAAHPAALVIRTNFYGWGPSYRPSFSDFIIGSLRRRERIVLFTDVMYSPILAESLARTAGDLMRMGTTGVVHVAGDDRISKYDFGVRVAGRFGLDADLISPGTLAERRSMVHRPLDMSLSSTKARTLLGRPLGGVEEQLARLHYQEQAGWAAEVQNL